jgi:hypothetical protein
MGNTPGGEAAAGAAPDNTKPRPNTPAAADAAPSLANTASVSVTNRDAAASAVERHRGSLASIASSQATVDPSKQKTGYSKCNPSPCLIHTHVCHRGTWIDGENV